MRARKLSQENSSQSSVGWRWWEVLGVVIVGVSAFGLYRSCGTTVHFNGPATINVQIGSEHVTSPLPGGDAASVHTDRSAAEQGRIAKPRAVRASTARPVASECPRRRSAAKPCQ